MKKNMGSTDRIVRVIAAIIITVLYLSGVLKGVVGLIMIGVGAIFLLTSVIGFCPLYILLGINTCKTRS